MKISRIIFVISDTHDMSDEDLHRLMAEAKKRKADIICHCGDIAPEHINAELFLGLPVICAHTKYHFDKQGTLKEKFRITPPGWTFTTPDLVLPDGETTSANRVCQLTEYEDIYVGHNMSFEFLKGSERKLVQKIQEIRNNYDNVKLLLSGHTHHQIYKQGNLISFINPGAAAGGIYSFDGSHEFAVINTGTGEIVFGRIPPTKSVRDSYSFAIIGESFKISEADPHFWHKLAVELRERDAKRIIHVGDINVRDIGRPELKDFHVYYNLRADQIPYEHSHKNWEQINPEKPVVNIDGTEVYVKHDLGVDLMKQSEIEMEDFCFDVRRKFPEVDFVAGGFTSEAFYEEGKEVRIINPGGIQSSRDYVVICQPRTEITFGHVPV